ncbi:MAG: hypothetical protein ACRDRX_15425 [Pseudonocardiaceae bacterium]
MYRVETDPDAAEQIAALPDDALADYAQSLVVLELVPWNGAPLRKDNPDGAVRTLPFGRAGMVTYLILERQHRVDVLKVLWAG